MNFLRTRVWGMMTVILCTLVSPAKSADFSLQTVEQGLDRPWSLAFMPDASMLITLRGGQLLHIKEGQRSMIEGLPDDIYVAGQGGLHDVVLHPKFADNGWVYLSYAAGSADCNQLRVVRGQIHQHQWQQQQDVLRVMPCKDTPVHYGARMAFLPDNTLVVTTGDGFDYREDAQRQDNQLGKTLRVTDTGGVPDDNPFATSDSPLAQRVFSIGHRNPQGLAYDSIRRVLIAHEHGPAGGDEINVIHAGQNYGWPVATHGRDYSGARISPFTSYTGMNDPLLDWTPSIAPSGLLVYWGSMFREWEGDLFVGALKDKALIRVEMDGLHVVAQETLLADRQQRIRDVRKHPDGSIYVLTDGEQAELLRLYKP